MPVRLPLGAPLVPDLLAQAHLGDVDALVLDVAAGGALRAGEVVPRGKNVVHRLAPREPRLHLAGQERHLAAGHVQPPPRLDEALVGLGLCHLGRVGEVPQGAGRAPAAGFPAPALAINDSRQKMEGDTLI